MDRAILAVKFTAAAPARAKAAVGGFLRYIQHRDRHPDSAPEPQVSGLLKYVAHRDRSTGAGRLFDREGQVTDLERRRLERFVVRSLSSLPTQPLGPGAAAGPPRAVYRMVLSPEHAAGLDLRRLTRATMSALEADLGAALPPWIAAEHRNTAHPHVHIVLAARREVASGRFQGLAINRRRLALMKDALAREVEYQRAGRAPGSPPAPTPALGVPTGLRGASAPSRSPAAICVRPARAESTLLPGRRHASRPRRRLEILAPRLARTLRGLARRYAAEAAWEAERERRRLEQEARSRG